MIKKVLLTAALLAPGLAYGQVSAPLDPTVVPAGTVGDFQVNFSNVHQTIDGFGASDMFASDWRPVADQLFCVNASDPGCAAPGIGLHFLRTGIESNGGASGELPYALTATARGATVWATSWTTPTGVTPGSSGTYGTYATALTNWANAMHSGGVSIYGISAQNEPDCGCNSGIAWGATDTANLQAVLGPALHGLNPSVKLLSPETAFPQDFNNYRSAIAGNSTANADVDIWSTHQYGNIFNATPDSSRRSWETEFAANAGGDGTYDPSIADAVSQLTTLHDALSYFSVSAWHYWWVSNTATRFNAMLINSDNSGSSALTKRYFAMGNWSRYVRPGWVRIGVTGSLSGIYGVTAFKNPSTGDFAIVAMNNSGSDLHSVSFGISGASISGSITPYVTSGTSIGALGSDGNLSAGSTSSGVPASITPSGNTFTSTVPYGVTTFVGRAL
jgi:glucuronoarabinoxylan endo-1,4-beta-xylanase